MSHPFEDVNREILTETAKLAAAYQDRFAGDAEGELRAWLQIAARREALVSDVYDAANREYRLPEPRCPAANVAWEALTLIWQQEAVHTRFVEVRLKQGLLEQSDLSADMLLWLGTMEGKFLVALTSRPGLKNALARIATRLGALFTPDKVPAFSLQLGEMDPREFFLLCAVLETTARQAYARMETLAQDLADKRPVRSMQLENLAGELRLKLLDETFHEEAFQEMAGWVVEGKLDARLEEHSCAERLARLLPRSSREGDDPASPHVLTHGGLQSLFASRGINVQLVDS